MKSVMSHAFGQVPEATIQRSKFNRSHGYKTTFNGGYLIPVFMDEVLPGDTMNLHMTSFARLTTPITPFMDNLFVESFFFFVPNRLIWTNFKKFMGEQANPGDSVDYMVPIMTVPGAGYDIGSLSDYLGLPTGNLGIYTHTSLWHRAYNLIWNEWFRDENLQNSAVVDLDDGPDTDTDYVLKRRGKRPDYFTSCLPWAQKGTAVSIPLGTIAPIKSTLSGNAIAVRQNTDAQTTFLRQTTGSAAVNTNDGTGTGAELTWPQIGNTGGESAGAYNYADLASATAATINQLRQAFATQKLYERDARGGTRYTEIVRSHFNVISPDARLQRPEYLGGGSSPINVHPIAQTSSTDATTPQGNLAAMATFSTRGHGFVKSFTEHGVLLGLVSVRADINYQQGLNRMYSRRTRLEFYWPALSHIGEQSVLNKEIYCQGDANDDLVFGYQERYAEYRYKPSQITGKYRSTATGTLDKWHLAQKFTALPVLNDSFIQDNPPIDRVVAVTTEPQFYFDAYFDYICARPMPTYSVPGMIDRF